MIRCNGQCAKFWFPIGLWKTSGPELVFPTCHSRFRNHSIYLIFPSFWSFPKMVPDLENLGLWDTFSKIQNYFCCIKLYGFKFSKHDSRFFEMSFPKWFPILIFRDVEWESEMATHGIQSWFPILISVLEREVRNRKISC